MSARRKNPYKLPASIYYQTLWTVKCYPWMLERVEDLITSTPNRDGQPKGNHVADPTARKAALISNYMNHIRIIEQERDKIQEEYKKGVWESIIDEKKYPWDADRATYSRHKRKFIYHVAVRLGIYIEGIE